MSDQMKEWLSQLTTELDVSIDLDTGAFLDVTREVAHNVSRPAAPLTLLYLGVAIGSGCDPTTALATVDALVAQWKAEKAAQGAPEPDSAST